MCTPSKSISPLSSSCIIFPIEVKGIVPSSIVILYVCLLSPSNKIEPPVSSSIPSPSSKSNSSSSKIPWGSKMVVPFSNAISSLKVPSCSCTVLITSSNVVSRTFVLVSKPLTTPVWVVKVLVAENVPVTSLRIKWARNSISGGLLLK